MAVTVFYANNNMQDIGVLKGFKLDMTVSMETGDNDFEVRTSIGGIETASESIQKIKRCIIVVGHGVVCLKVKSFNRLRERIITKQAVI